MQRLEVIGHASGHRRRCRVFRAEAQSSEIDPVSPGRSGCDCRQYIACFFADSGFLLLSHRPVRWGRSHLPGPLYLYARSVCNLHCSGNTVHMEQPGLRKLGTVMAMLALAGVLVCVMPATNAVIRKIPLRAALSSVGDWKNEGFSPLDKELIAALNLDDYLNARYSRGQGTAYLYAGYYGSAKKAGAAHDPLVCLHGQGWVVNESAGDVVVLRDGKRINCSYMVVERDEVKEVIVYWFQSYRSTCSSTVSQKVVSLWNKFAANREDMASIMIIVPVRDSATSARQVAHDFAASFYPVFIEIIDNA